VHLSAKNANLLRACLLLIAVIVDVWLLTIIGGWRPGTDALASWAVDLNDPWRGAGESMLGAGVFRYSPVMAQLASLFGWLPWVAYQYAFLALQLLAIVWMAGRRWPYVVLFPPVFWNLYFGNVDLLMGAAIVAGFRWPGTWAFLFVTKVTPFIGVLWFAFRREWRRFAIALGVTAAICLGSFVLAPHLWTMWVDALRVMSTLPQSTDYPPLVWRLPLAAALTYYAARTDRRWLLPVACLAAVPNPWFVTFAILGASIALWPGSPASSPVPTTDPAEDHP
jgi:hypothetical protein